MISTFPVVGLSASAIVSTSSYAVVSRILSSLLGWISAQALELWDFFRRLQGPQELRKLHAIPPEQPAEMQD
jgi:hypothetical protein